MKNLFFLVIVIILSGCGRGLESHQTSEARTLEPGFEMIDQGRYDDAIAYFQHLYDVKPDDGALKAWASVYVARAGLKISAFYKAYATFPKNNIDTDSLIKNNILLQIQTYQKSLEQIPNIKGEARADLEKAASILQIRNTQSVRLFRSIVNVVLLRSTFSDGDKLLLNANLKVDLQQGLKVVCKLDWKRLRSWLQVWTLYGLELKKDLDFAFPARKKEWKDGEKFFTDTRKFSTTLERSCEL